MMIVPKSMMNKEKMLLRKQTKRFNFIKIFFKNVKKSHHNRVCKKHFKILNKILQKIGTLCLMFLMMFNFKHLAE
jgi:hypothetical protein